MSEQPFEPTNGEINLVPQYGERGLILGRTGSGKTAFARWLLGHMPGTVIYDTKGEPKFSTLADTIVSTVKDAMEVIKDKDYVILRPPVHMITDPMALDGLLHDHYHTGENVTAYIDEIYQFHKGFNAGPGLISLLTRGRSKGITTLMSSQRPAWISRFTMSESQHFYLFPLTDKRDHKNIESIVPDYLPLRTRNFHFRYYNYDMAAPILFAPIPFEGSEGYTDSESPNTQSGWL